MSVTMFDSLKEAIHFAPRGKKRLLDLGNLISQRYLRWEDKLIGMIGGQGAGKSLLLRGMFPGLELVNDDYSINKRPMPLLEDVEEGNFRYHTYHVDVRFENAFNQLGTIARTIQQGLEKERRIVVEYFDLIYPILKRNAQILVGIGEEVIITRPTILGPEPKEIGGVVFKSLKYRKRAHTAEDLTSLVFENLGFKTPVVHSDVYHGFVFQFDKPVEIDLQKVEDKVKEYIRKDLLVSFLDEGHIEIGDITYPCTGPRIHVSRTGEIKNFRLNHQWIECPVTKKYLLVGRIDNAS